MLVKLLRVTVNDELLNVFEEQDAMEVDAIADVLPLLAAESKLWQIKPGAWLATATKETPLNGGGFMVGDATGIIVMLG